LQNRSTVASHDRTATGGGASWEMPWKL